MIFLAEITGSDIAIIAAVFGALQAVITIGDRLWGSKKKSGKEDEIALQVKSLYDMHNHFDADGSPMWYVPRSWAKTQETIANTQRDIVDTQRNISSTLDVVAKTLDRFERHIESH